MKMNPFRGCSFSIWSDLNVDPLGDCISLTCCGDKTILKEKKKERISFWDNIHNGFIQAGAGSFFSRTLLLIPDPYVECKRELISVSRPRHSGRCQVWGSSLPFYWCDQTALRLRDWMPRLPSSPLPHTGHFWICSLLTSRCTDKWIDSGKMAEEIQPRAWKWLTFPLHPPPQQIKLSGIIYAVYKQ